jgi:phage terminase small subunit
MPKQKGLNAKQQRFVAAYRADPNATKAAIAAGYSAKTAYSAGARLLKNVEVAAALNKKLAQDVEKFDITGDKVLEELRAIGFADLTHAGIAKIAETGDLGAPSAFTVKCADKLKALELLGKNLKLFVDRVEHSGSLTLEQLVAGGGDE